MKYFRYMTGLSVLLSVQLVFAVDVTDQGIISQLQKVREQLRQSAGASTDCQTPDAANCNFQDYCQQFAGKGKDFYLYQNAEGRKVYNYHLLENISEAETCLGKSYSQAPVQDPFAYPEQLIDPAKAGGEQKVRENYQRYLKEVKRTEGIFNDVQDRMVQILRNRRTKDNAKAIDNMIARITTVKISTADATDLASPAVKGCDIPNAGYSIYDHKLTVCPQLMNLPDAALFNILAHELTHAIDPCTMAMFYTREKGVITMTEKNFRIEEPPPKDPFFIPITVDANPFKDTIACLQKPESIGIKIPAMESVIAATRKNTEDAIGTKEEVAAYQDPDATDATDLIRTQMDEKIQGIRTHYKEFKQCYSLSSSGHLTEGFADWMSSQVLKQKIAEIPDSGKAKTYANESQIFFMAVSCPNISQAALSVIRPMMKGNCSNTIADLETRGIEETDTHPGVARRVNRLIYAPAEIQKALGCKKTAGLVECQ